jgi:uncharacterized protein
MNTPFHGGELAIQARVGVQSKIADVGKRLIRDYMPEQHRQFFAQLPFLLIGAVDETARPWASILVGNPGFISSPNPKSLQINSNLPPGAPIKLQTGMPVGLLGIELPTRRRNRMNGHIAVCDRQGFSVDVVQSFGNCHKYIQKRDSYFITDRTKTPAHTVKESQHLTIADRDLIRQADTFFIASANGRQDLSQSDVDISHRGGKPGFIAIDGNILTVPDFAGNNYFNTLGNLHNFPKAGLLFIDFVGGDLLYVATDTEVIWKGKEVSTFFGAERLLRFHVQKVRRVTGSLPLRWTAPEFSPHLNATGSWIS